MSEISNHSYAMGCPPIRGDNRALASGLSYVQVEKHCITSLYNLHQCRPCTSCNSYTMACPPVRGDNTRALASGLSYEHVDKHGITSLYHPTSVLRITKYFMVRVV